MKLSNMIFILLFSWIMLFTGCNNTTNITPASQTSQKIVAKAKADIYEVDAGDQVSLDASQSLLNNENVTYTWLDSDKNIISTDSTAIWTAPQEPGNYKIALVLNYSQVTQKTDALTIKVKEQVANTDTTDITPTQDATFTTIHQLINKSRSGALHDVTYICIGDSTRAYTNFEGLINHAEYIFRDVNATLATYHVTSYLFSQGGLSFKTFSGEHYIDPDPTEWIQWEDILSKIPADGTDTIVDISLGVNDFLRLKNQYDWATEKETIRREIKSSMLQLIENIKSQKPAVKIMLTVPNPIKDWETGSKLYNDIYKEVASEEKLPLANFVEDIMPAYYSAAFNAWYHDGIHFNDYGMTQLSDYILEKILPTP